MYVIMTEKNTFNKSTMDQNREIAASIRRGPNRNGAAQVGVALYIRDADDPDDIHIRPIEFEDATPEEKEMTAAMFSLQKLRPPRSFFHYRSTKISDFVKNQTDDEIVEKVSIKSLR